MRFECSRMSILAVRIVTILKNFEMIKVTRTNTTVGSNFTMVVPFFPEPWNPHLPGASPPKVGAGE
jgi:hypothetical protein